MFNEFKIIEKKQMLHVGNIFTNHVSRSVAVFGPLNGHRGASRAWHFADKRMIQSVITEKTHWPFFQDRTSTKIHAIEQRSLKWNTMERP